MTPTMPESRFSLADPVPAHARARAWWANRERLPLGVWLAALGLFALLLAVANGYGVFRDELYYLACADHLAWGYVDHPPLSIAILAAWRAVAGESLLALRFLPAVAGAALVVLTGLLARSLGGSRRAQTVAAIATATAPGLVGMIGFYSMNAFDLLFWALATLVVVHVARDDAPRGWLLFGLLVGLGLQNKLSVGFLAVAIAAAMLVTPLRRHLRTPWPWLGALAAAALIAPHLAWQAIHDWPTAEFVANATRFKIKALEPGAWLADFALGLGPPSVLLWVPGLVWLLAAPSARRYRGLGVAAVAVLVWLALGGGKTYYARPIVPLLFASGGLAIDALARGRRWVLPAVGAVVGISGALLLPFGIPVLAPEELVAYQARLGVAPPQEENQRIGRLPQHFADRFGWEGLTAAVADAWRALPPSERERTLIVTGNYGEAGAIRRFGPAYGLPPAVSQHNSYYLWGPGRPLDTIDTVLAVGIGPDGLREAFADVRPAGTVQNPWAMPYETGDILWIARDPIRPLAESWAAGKHYI